MLTWASITSAILGLIRGIALLFNKSVDWFKERALIKMGRQLQAGEMAQEEIEVNRKQTEILSQTVTKDQTEKKLRDGNF